MSPSKPPQRTRRAARAKINLYLHVLGRRADGYHDLDSLVVFGDFGDEIEVAQAPDLSLRVRGPFADQVPPSADNLVLRAAESLREAAQVADGAKITLAKRLPVAAGLGGGSADAAATLHALRDLWEIDPAKVNLTKIAADLGADVPVCLNGQPSLVKGRGEDISPSPPLPPCHFVFVNPGEALSTADVFGHYQGAGTLPVGMAGAFPDARALARALSKRRNDLEPPARALAPVIGDVLRLVGETPGCLLARMSGSGATCFGLFEDSVDAEAAAGILRGSKPNWWVEASAMCNA